MSRTKREIKTTADKIIDIENKISETEQQLAKLKEERKTLLQKKHDEEVSELLAEIKNRGLSIDEARHLIVQANTK